MDGTHRMVAVIGGGQAGLSMSYHLMQHGIDHVLLEAKQAGSEWRERRWDSFCLVTPNWQCRLPGFHYQGAEPDGFMVREEITRYLDEYVKSFNFPLVEQTAATRLRRGAGGRFLVTTTAGEFTADQVVVATGPYQVPRTPRISERLPETITQLHSADYRNPGQLPPGDVLVVGSIDGYIAAGGITAPPEPRYTPVWEPGDDRENRELDLIGACVTSVVWATGFGADYRWIEVPVFDGRGYPTHSRDDRRRRQRQ